MAEKKLKNDRDIQQLKPTEKTYVQSMPGGLYVRVLPSGRKSFLTVFSFEGKQHWLTLGRYPDLSLAKARKKVAKIREKVADGINPVLE
ncbi:MAG: Arm DNA-binding domain-containing protein, partial [Pelovirga sp.]